MGSGFSRRDKDKDEDFAPHTVFSPSSNRSSRAGPGRKGHSVKEREEQGKQSGHWQPKVPKVSKVSNQSLSEVLESWPSKERNVHVVLVFLPTVTSSLVDEDDDNTMMI